LNDPSVFFARLLDSPKKIRAVPAKIFDGYTISGARESSHLTQAPVFKTSREIAEKIQPGLRHLCGPRAAPK
jgi:hypothetical protein